MPKKTTAKRAKKTARPVTAKNKWKHSFNRVRGFTVVAEERVKSGRSGIPYVEVRITDPGTEKGKKKKRSWRTTGLRVRDETGALVPELVQAALEAATRIYEDVVGALVKSGSTYAATAAGRAGRLTIRQGFERFFADGTGLMALDTPHRRDSKRNAEVAMAAVGENTAWEDLDETHKNRLLAALADLRDAEGNVQWSKAERVGTLFWQCRDWVVADNGWAKQTQGNQRPRRWMLSLRNRVTAQLLADETAKGKRRRRLTSSTPVARPAPTKAFYTRGELKRLYLCIQSEGVHPKMRLLAIIFPFARLGQAVRVMRSQLARRWPDVEHQRLATPGEGRKQGSCIVLSATDTLFLSAAMRDGGYLRDLELAYQKRAIDDYAIFPAHRLKKGVAPLNRDVDLCLNDRSLHDYMRAWEDAAGVEHRAARGHRGLRHTFAEQAEVIAAKLDIPERPRVLDIMSGHEEQVQLNQSLPLSTRQTVYLRKLPLHLLEAGAQIREHPDWIPAMGDLDKAALDRMFGGQLPPDLREKGDDDRDD